MGILGALLAIKVFFYLCVYSTYITQSQILNIYRTILQWAASRTSRWSHYEDRTRLDERMTHTWRTGNIGRRVHSKPEDPTSGYRVHRNVVVFVALLTWLVVVLTSGGFEPGSLGRPESKMVPLDRSATRPQIPTTVGTLTNRSIHSATQTWFEPSSHTRLWAAHATRPLHQLKCIWWRKNCIVGWLTKIVIWYDH